MVVLPTPEWVLLTVDSCVTVLFSDSLLYCLQISVDTQETFNECFIQS